jgi:hypothetical protein
MLDKNFAIFRVYGAIFRVLLFRFCKGHKGQKGHEGQKGLLEYDQQLTFVITIFVPHVLYVPYKNFKVRRVCYGSLDR